MIKNIISCVIRIFGFILLLSLIILSCTTSSIGQDQELSLVSELSGTIKPMEDHWFSINSMGSSSLRVETFGLNGSVLIVLDDNNQEIARTSGGVFSNAKLVIPVIPERTYIIRLYRAQLDRNRDYRIASNLIIEKAENIDQLRMRVAQERYIREAREISFGQEISGSLPWPRGEHWYKIITAETETVLITVNNSRVNIEIYDNNNNLVTRSTGNNAPRLEFNTVEDKLYYIRLVPRTSDGNYRILVTDLVAVRAKVEENFRNVLFTRNVETILAFINSTDLNPLQSSERTAIIREGELEIAKILTGNNNVQVGDFLQSWERYWGHSGRTVPLNSNAFIEGMVYRSAIIPDQIIDGLIFTQLSNTVESSVLYRNVSPQDIRRSGREYLPIRDVFLVYTGQFPIRINGRTISLPLFNVLHYARP